MPTRNINVLIGDDHRDAAAEIVRQCESAGMHVEQRIEIAGILLGSIDASKIPDIERIPGIAAVEVERSFQLPPPDDPLQ